MIERTITKIIQNQYSLLGERDTAKLVSMTLKETAVKNPVMDTQSFLFDPKYMK